MSATRICIPAYASYGKDRLSLYREAAKEAKDIFDRWADEYNDLDEDKERVRDRSQLRLSFPSDRSCGKI